MSNRDAWSAMRDKLQAMGRNTQVTIGEPRGAVQDGQVAIIPTSGSVPETVLNGRRESHTVTLRRYANLLREPAEDVEFEMDEWRGQILDDIDGDFELGGAIAYPLPIETTWTYGYQTIGPEDRKNVYRILDVTIGYRIDPAATYAA